MGELDFGIKIEEEHDTTYDFLNKSICEPLWFCSYS